MPVEAFWRVGRVLRVSSGKETHPAAVSLLSLIQQLGSPCSLFLCFVGLHSRRNQVMGTVSRETLGLSQARSGNSGHHPASQLPPLTAGVPPGQSGQAERKTGSPAPRPRGTPGVPSHRAGWMRSESGGLGVCSDKSCRWKLLGRVKVSGHSQLEDSLVRSEHRGGGWGG